MTTFMPFDTDAAVVLNKVRRNPNFFAAIHLKGQGDAGTVVSFN
jgi:hypothetical protein